MVCNLEHGSSFAIVFRNPTGCMDYLMDGLVDGQMHLWQSFKIRKNKVVWGMISCELYVFYAKLLMDRRIDAPKSIFWEFLEVFHKKCKEEWINEMLVNGLLD